MKNTSRRKFLQHSALASTSLFIPAFLKGFDNGVAQLGNKTNRRLIIVQLSGGNDGLNTLVPYRNDIYYKNRPTLAIPANEVIRLNDDIGLNGVMNPLQHIFDDGNLCVLNSVGYPDPDRSHFRSMDIWQTGSGANEFLSSGWLGRYLDANCQDCEAHYALEMDDTLSLALKGMEKNGFAASNINKLQRSTKNRFLQAISKHHHDHDHEENVAYLYQTMRQTFSSSDYLHEQSKIYTARADYPKGNFGKALKQTAELIISGSDTRIYYTSMTGFDTHTRQKITQERLLGNFAVGMKALTDDLKANKCLDDTLILVFSEFGRRVKQNASGGTDHGTANNVFLIGGKLNKPGVYNAAPNLSQLDKGDLIYEIDFRRIYATILKKWLYANDTPVLGQQFELMDFI